MPAPPSKPSRSPAGLGALTLLFTSLALRPALGAPLTEPGALERGFTSLTRDESLSRAAARHLSALAASRAPATLAAVRAALRAEGLADAQVLPFAVFGSQRAELEVQAFQFFDGRVVGRGYTHFGLAWATFEGKDGLVVLFVRRLLELPPLPAARPPPSVRGVLLTEAPLVEGFFTLRSGQVRRVSAARRGREVRLVLPEDEAVAALELVAHTERGPEVAAWVSYAAPPRPAPPPPRDEAELLSTLSRLRADFGAGPLEASPALRRAASAHAKWVCEARLAVHRRPDGQSPIDRARAVGHRGPVLENIAIASSLEEAHQNLLDSPSHRINLLSPEASRIGVGLAERALPSGRMICLVELLGAR